MGGAAMKLCFRENGIYFQRTQMQSTLNVTVGADNSQGDEQINTSVLSCKETRLVEGEFDGAG